MEVDTVLSDFESSDFGEMSEDFFGLRRLYVILGSCLFYKSYLIANHLPKEDLLDVCLYCQHFCLLPLASEQRLGQLVIWREVFPQQRASGGGSAAPGFTQPKGRHFLLIVGLRHLMQCVLLEAGGCASPALASPGPDCVYVDQVKATLLQLEVLEAGMEERLNVPSAPCLSCADWFLPAATTRDRLDSLASSSPVFSKLAGAIRGSPSGSRGRSLFGERSRKSSPQRSLSDSGSEVQMDAGSAAPGLSPNSTPDSARRHGGRRDSLGSGGSDGSGGSGGLFKGIFIAPTHREVAQLSGSIHPQLIRNFHHCCLSIRAAFQQSLPARDRRAADRPQRSCWGLGPVKEHGVLFQCKPENWTDQRKPAPTMTYWVIGYVCVQIGIIQLGSFFKVNGAANVPVSCDISEQEDQMGLNRDTLLSQPLSKINIFLLFAFPGGCCWSQFLRSFMCASMTLSRRFLWRWPSDCPLVWLFDASSSSEMDDDMKISCVSLLCVIIGISDPTVRLIFS
ncbi:hypothetical protein GOODEAATRI_009282 [Goodea atripinnis]|uniref:Uncharacterized protein n=1 Tax=Goodea atripinnis TaxID=208336 RepID=A0ABV0N978_9TELE